MESLIRVAAWIDAHRTPRSTDAEAALVRHWHRLPRDIMRERLLNAAEFFAGYPIAKALTVDDIFAFLMSFTFFGVRPPLRRRVLSLGVIVAIVLLVSVVGSLSVTCRRMSSCGEPC